MESIYKYICQNIQNNGKLKDTFNLDIYDNTHNEELKFAPGALDGINYYHSKIESDEEVFNYIIEKLKKINVENIEETANDIVEYFNNSEKKVLATIDSILEWIIENKYVIDFNSVFRLALYLVIESNSIEALKIAIGIIGLIDLSKEKELKDVLIRLALCDEFTLYSIVALGNLENANDIRFMLIKKVNGWGKIHLLNSIEVTNDIIKEWLIINGCKNEVHLGYTASIIAEKINLIEVLNRDVLTKEEFLGINDIMKGLFDDGPINGAPKNYIELIKKYIKHFRKFIYDLDFYDIPILLSMFLFNKDTKSKEDIEIASEIMNLMDSNEIVETLKKSVNDDEKLPKVINVIKYNKEINLYSEIYEKYKQNPFEYYYCLEYLLKNDIFKKKSIELLSNVLDLEKYYSKPENIFGMKERYSNNLVFIIQILKDYPFLGNDFIIAGIKSRYMQPRNAALNTIESWINITNRKFKDFPKEIYNAVVELQKTEIIKNYKIRINELLEIKENLSEYNDPPTIWSEESNGEDLNLEIFDDKMDDLFESQIKMRGNDYYHKQMVYSCNETSNRYIAFVQGSDFAKEYEVKIEKNENGKIKSITCNCPYPNHCKHEYATILYLREKIINYKNKV